MWEMGGDGKVMGERGGDAETGQGPRRGCDASQVSRSRPRSYRIRRDEGGEWSDVEDRSRLGGLVAAER